MINGCSMIPAITTSTLTSTLPLQQNAWQDMLQNDSSLDLYNRPVSNRSSSHTGTSPSPQQTQTTHQYPQNLQDPFFTIPGETQQRSVKIWPLSNPTATLFQV